MHRFADDDFVRGISKFDQYFVLSGFQSDEDNRFTAGIHKVPGRVIDSDVEMTDARRYVEGTDSEHWYHAQILCAVLDEDATLCQRFGKRWIDN